MKFAACALVILSATLRARSKAPVLEFDMMTWQEVKQAIQSGKTTALVYNGGTEQRGPQNVNGGHTLIARETGRRNRGETRQRRSRRCYRFLRIMPAWIFPARSDLRRSYLPQSTNKSPSN